jgi:DNA-binding transcriptional LysR family regulator
MEGLMDRLEAMAILVAATETGSLSGAGRRLGTPLATVSRKIADLETHLGTQLLTRGARRLALTDAGSDYVAACRRILEQVGEAERTAAGEYQAPRGQLLLTAPIVFGRLHVLPAVTDFLARHADIQVRLLLSDRNQALVEDHIDLAVRIGELPDSSLVAIRVGTVRRVTCASPDFLARFGVPQVPADLSALPCVSFDAMAAATTWSFAGPKARERMVAIRPRLSVNTAEAALDAAIAGAGLTRVLSYQAAEAVAAGRLAIVLQAFEPAPLPVSLLHAGQGLQPLKLRAFLDFAAPFLRERLAAV